jgi:hypothetical protein
MLLAHSRERKSAMLFISAVPGDLDIGRNTRKEIVAVHSLAVS